MDFNTSAETTGQFSKNDFIVRQSSDRDPVTGLITYSIHVSTQIQVGTEKIYGQWKSHEVSLNPKSVAVVTSRMGIALADLNDIGTKYTNLLRAIVDYSQNPPEQAELDALGIVEPVIAPPPLADRSIL